MKIQPSSDHLQFPYIAVDRPNIKFVDCHGLALEAFDKCLMIKLGNLREDVVGLLKVNGKNDVFVGTLHVTNGLENDDGVVSVSMDGSDYMEVCLSTH